LLSSIRRASPEQVSGQRLARKNRGGLWKRKGARHIAHNQWHSPRKSCRPWSRTDSALTTHSRPPRVRRVKSPSPLVWSWRQHIPVRRRGRFSAQSWLLGGGPPSAVAPSLLVGSFYAKNALPGAYHSRPVLLGFDRLPWASSRAILAHVRFTQASHSASFPLPAVR
jgi:hypothetical protein